MQQFLNDRDEALLSLDETKLRAYMQKYGAQAPADSNVFWCGVHKAITGYRLTFAERVQLGWQCEGLGQWMTASCHFENTDEITIISVAMDAAGC